MSLLFISVVRQGLSRGLAIADASAQTLATRTLDDALKFKASATLDGFPATDVDLRLLGPGEVRGIDPALVLRTDPPAGAQRVDTSLFCQVELDLPALPWMFTPLAAASGRLRPWIALVVVPFEEGESPLDRRSPLDLEPLRHGRLPVLEVPSAAHLPPIDQTWAWAHAQVATSAGGAGVPADLEQLVADHPEAGISRLLCPRKLEADRHYVAAVVPTFEAMRAAGLGAAPVTTAAPAWGLPSTAFPLKMPVLHHWEFFTAEAGNFEQAVRRLRGTDPPAAAGRVMDASDPGHPLAAIPAPLPLAGALRPEKLTITQYSGPAVAGYDTLTTPGQSVTTAAGRTYPLVTLPLYGGRHTAAPSLSQARVWVKDLNSDPRHRAAAALGARIVRENQEALMRSAWEQAGDVEEANRRLRRARLGRAASTRIVARHIKPLDGADRLRVLAPGFGRLGLPAGDRTLAGLVAASRLPDLLLGPAFTSLTRPGGRLGRHLAPTPEVVTEVATGIDAGTLQPDRGELGRPGGLVTLDGVLALADAARDSVRGGGGRTPIALGAVAPTAPGTTRISISAATTGERNHTSAIRLTDSTGMVGATGTLRGDFALPAAAATSRITPADLTAEKVRGLPGTIELQVGASTIDVTEAHRSALADLFEALDPGDVVVTKELDIAKVAGQALLAVEPGAAIARAVLGRMTLPEDATGDDPLEDVLAAPQFPAPLAPELIRLAPDLVLPGLDEVERDRVFAVLSNSPFVHAVLAGANHEVMRELRWRGYPTDERGTAFHRFWREDADEIPDLHTIRTGKLGEAVSGGVSDVVVVVRSDLLARFPGTLVYAVAATGQGTATTPSFSKVVLPVFGGRLADDASYFGFPFSAADATGSPGYYLAFQEPATAPSFGLDVSSAVATFPAKAGDLAWTNTPQTGEFVDAAPIAGGKAFTDNDATWGANAADQAASTYQQPVRAAIHFRDLLGGP